MEKFRLKFCSENIISDGFKTEPLSRRIYELIRLVLKFIYEKIIMSESTQNNAFSAEFQTDFFVLKIRFDLYIIEKLYFARDESESFPIALKKQLKIPVTLNSENFSNSSDLDAD